MHPDGQSEAERSAAQRESATRSWIVRGVAIGLAAGAAVLLVVWWRSGGPRRAVKELAEEGAVKLADVLVDEIFPAA